MLVTQREAARRLATVGVSRARARRLLHCGLAGEPVTCAGALLYDAELVEALVAREHVDLEDLASACPDGVFVARRDVDVLEGTASVRTAVSGGWPLSLARGLWLAMRAERGAPVPLVATVCGFVVHGAEIERVVEEVAARPTRRDPYEMRFELADPGPWFEVFENRRFHTGSGRPWTFCGWSETGVTPFRLGYGR